MLNPFPSLLTYSFFAPLLLRVAAALTLMYMAQHMVHNRKTIIETELPIIGKPKEWLVYVSAGVTLTTSFLLFVGLATQWAALVGVIIALKHGLAPKRFAPILPLTTATCLLLCALCASLLLSGAGPLAFDIRL